MIQKLRGSSIASMNSRGLALAVGRLLVPAVLALPLRAQGTDESRAFGPGQLAAEFSEYDQNGDGVLEIERLRVCATAGESGPWVFVFVEERLLEGHEGAVDIEPALRRHLSDLTGEGWRAALFGVEFSSVEAHRDGRLLLALREVLRAASERSELAGVVLVGRFPDAFIVRTCNWRKREALTLRKGTPEERRYAEVSYLRRVPEAVAHRADIVLADLDGDWESVYVEPRSRLETVYASYPDGIPQSGGPCEDLERGSVTFEDFFHVNDGRLEVRERLDGDGNVAGLSLELCDTLGDRETSCTDRERGNPLARPEIMVSRIDARGVALRPRASVRDASGRALLDDAGLPQTLEFDSEESVPHWSKGIWETDPILERRLLVEYFDRNHAYRAGDVRVALRPASIAHGLPSGIEIVCRASRYWHAVHQSEGDVHGDPGLVQLVDWLRYPAILRTLRAHSDPWGSVFAGGDVGELEAKLGGSPWSWTQRGTKLEPSLEAACAGGKLDWFLLRSLWAGDGVAAEPSFYLHTGCHGISPSGAARRPFDHPEYGVRQGAESLLFFAEGLALVGRAKVFYDEPRGFCEALSTGATFGEAWTRYFELESEADSWGEVGGDIGRKRAYFWSVLGDWTLNLQSAR